MRASAVIIILTLILSGNSHGKHSGEGSGENAEESGSGGKHSTEYSVKYKKSDGQQIKFSYNPKYGGHLSNEKEQTVVVLGYITNTTGFFDGRTGEVFIFVSTESSAVYIPPGASDKTWLAQKQSFSEYAKNLYPLKDLYKIGEKKGIKFTAETIPKDVQKNLAKILLSQSPSYKDECKALAYAMEISKIPQVTKIEGFEPLLDKPVDNLDLKGDLQSTGTYFSGWKVFFGDFDGAMEALKKENVKLDFEELLNSETEFQLLSLFLKGLAPHSNLVNITKKRLNVEWKFFELIGKFGGEVNYGFSGFLYVVSGCVRFLHGEASEESVAIILKEYFTSDRAVQDDYQKKWKSSISAIVTAIEVLKIDGQLEDIFKILQRIQKEKWIINEVDMYAVLKIIWGEKLPGKEKSVTKVLKGLKEKKGKDKKYKKDRKN